MQLNQNLWDFVPGPGLKTYRELEDENRALLNGNYTALKPIPIQWQPWETHPIGEVFIGASESEYLPGQILDISICFMDSEGNLNRRGGQIGYLKYWMPLPTLDQ
jgi:hypothetical protein